MYRVRNWRQFQHYKDRNPPWIKLHFAMLSSRDWVMLDDASRVLAIACMLIASRNDGLIHNDPDYLRRVAYLSNVDFKPLIDCGFLEVASETEQMLATARPETEERRGEKETDSRAKHAETPKPNGRYWELPDNELAEYARARGISTRGETRQNLIAQIKAKAA